MRQITAASASEPTGLTSLWRLAGRWHLSRRISHASGQVDRFDGICIFSRAGPRLIQDESGELLTGEGRFTASRRYIWTEDDGRLDVHFADMRPFHSVPLGCALVETTYLCPPDRYQVAYDFTAWPCWTSTWTVEGPRKNYTMTNHHAPESGREGNNA